MSSLRLRTLLVRWHLPGILLGSVAAASMLTYFSSSPGHPVHAREQLIGWSYCLAALAIPTPLLLGFLMLWQVATRRFPILESAFLVRLGGLIVLAAVTAATLDLLITVGIVLWLANRDNVPFTNVWQNPFEFRQFYLALFAATSAWALLPRLFFTFRPITRTH